MKLFGWYKNSSHLYIAMEDVQLGDLGSLCRGVARLPENEARHIALQIFQALAYVHSHNFVHGDVELGVSSCLACVDKRAYTDATQKVLIVSMPPQNWRVKLCGFRHAVFFEDTNKSEPTIPATDGYQAPESSLGILVKSLGQAQATDVWAAGETVYRLLVGRGAFGNDVQLLCDYFYGHRKFPNRDLTSLRVSYHGRGFIEHAMLADPVKRPRAQQVIAHGWLNEIQTPLVPISQSFVCSWAHQCEANEDPPQLRFSPGGTSLIMFTTGMLYSFCVPLRYFRARRGASGSPFKDAYFRSEDELLVLTLDGRIIAIDVELFQTTVLVQATTQEAIMPLGIAASKHRFARACVHQGVVRGKTVDACRIDLFDYDGGKIGSCSDLPEDFIAMAFDLDGFALIAAFSRKMLRMGVRTAPIPYGTEFEVLKVAFCPTRSSVAYCDSKHKVFYLDTKSMDLVSVGQPLPSSPCRSLSLGAGGQVLSVTRDDAMTTLYDIHRLLPPVAIQTDIILGESVVLSPRSLGMAVTTMTLPGWTVRLLGPRTGDSVLVLAV